MDTVSPLKGDGAGKYRIHIVGNTGAGKSTLAADLGEILGVPCFHLDRFFWKPGWEQSSGEDMKERVRAALDGSPDGWVVDGNYQRRIGSFVSDEATDIIWLDPPFILYFLRLCKRTFLRLLRLAPATAPGCNEGARAVFFSKDSIILWCISHHKLVKKQCSESAREDDVRAGGKWRRLGGWGRELREWKESVRKMSIGNQSQS